MYRCQFYLLNLSLVLCLIVGCYYQANANPVDGGSNDSPTTTLAPKSNGNNPVQAGLSLYSRMGIWTPFGGLPLRIHV